MKYRPHSIPRAAPSLLRGPASLSRRSAPGFSGVINVIALAPMDAGAPAEGTIPLGDFSALVLNRTSTQVDGFVAATAQKPALRLGIRLECGAKRSFDQS